MVADPHTGVSLSAADFRKLYTGFDTELLLGIMSYVLPPPALPFDSAVVARFRRSSTAREG